MDALSWLTQNIKNLNVAEVFNTSEDAEWIWVNKLVFADILYGLGFESEEDEADMAPEDFDEESVFELLQEALKPEYIKMNQFLFSTWEKNFKPTKDMRTIIFVKKKLYRKISIDCQRSYGWFLKAMAVDTYYKINSEYNNLRECYEEVYEDNYRIIEELLSLKKYLNVSAYWQYEIKENALYFYKKNKIMNRWTEQEAESLYNELASS